LITLNQIILSTKIYVLIKSLQFLTLCLVLLFCTTSCVEQLETDLLQAETENGNYGLAMIRTLPPKITSLTEYCNTPGAVALVEVDYTRYANVIHLDIFSEDGFKHIGRYSKNNPNAVNSMTLVVGMPLDGNYGCSILNAETTYRIQVAKDAAPVPSEWPIWSSWPNALIIDGFTTLGPCRCSIRR